jgi:hypothetical protein
LSLARGHSPCNRRRPHTPLYGGFRLKEEILTKISEDSDIAERLIAKAPAPPEDRPLGEVLEGLAPQVTADRARAVIENPPRIPVEPGLEAIVLVMGRPVLLVQNDDFDLQTLETDTWKDRFEQARERLKAAVLSVGRIDMDNNPQFDWVGTA